MECSNSLSLSSRLENWDPLGKNDINKVLLKSSAFARTTENPQSFASSGDISFITQFAAYNALNGEGKTNVCYFNKNLKNKHYNKC